MFTHIDPLGRIVGKPEKCPEQLENGILATKKLCRISSALRLLNSDSDFLGCLVIRNGHHRRDASLDLIDIQFPKVETRTGIAHFPFTQF